MPGTQPIIDRSRARKLGLAVALVVPSIVTWLYFVQLTSAPAALQQTVYVGGKTLQFAWPLVFLVFVLGRRPRFGRPPRQGLAEGLASGLFACIATALLFSLLARFQPEFVALIGEQVAAKVKDLEIDTGLRYLAVAVFYSLIHSGLEEYYWRWFVYGQMRRFLGVRWAIVLAALAFLAHHVILIGVYTGWNWWSAAPLALAVAAGGAYWCSLYERSGSLAGPWISHLLVDAAIFAAGWRLL